MNIFDNFPPGIKNILFQRLKHNFNLLCIDYMNLAQNTQHSLRSIELCRCHFLMNNLLDIYCIHLSFNTLNKNQQSIFNTDCPYENSLPFPHKKSSDQHHCIECILQLHTTRISLNSSCRRCHSNHNHSRYRSQRCSLQRIWHTCLHLQHGINCHSRFALC